jgi:hypothetical protein
MANRRSGKRLVRKGEPSQKTDKGLEIPIPKRSTFNRNLRKAAKAPDSETKSRPKQ